MMSVEAAKRVDTMEVPSVNRWGRRCGKLWPGTSWEGGVEGDEETGGQGLCVGQWTFASGCMGVLHLLEVNVLCLGFTKILNPNPTATLTH